ncbi:helix-turn-helix domain-containing protein, partial [Jeotgalibacillus sp. ET6]|uniref:helix-turn-helix domain-containing protein n=1 Tax=Jeotgalibacillus sp. ET6 TaxID=3037260 RepID=UPI002418A747
NELQRALALCDGEEIDVGDLSERVVPGPARAVAPHVGGDFTLEEIERAHIEKILARGLTYDDAARLLGIDDSTLWRKRRRFTLRSA